MERGREGREGQVGREGAAGREGLPGEPGEAGQTGAEGQKGETGNALPRSVRIAFIAVVAVGTLMLGALGLFAVENRERANEGRAAHDALCVVKANFQVRQDRTEEFLNNNPGPLILGIPRREFERSLNDTKETLKALRVLICVPPARPTTTQSLP